MKTLDFSSAGIKDGFVKFWKVIGWHLTSDVLVVVTGAVANYHPTVHQSEYAGIVAAAIALANAVIAGIGKWLSVHQDTPFTTPPTNTSPDDIIPSIG